MLAGRHYRGSGLEPGDWAWLSDGEVIVGAQLAIDDRYGLVGVPDWDTIVHLDEEGADDFDRVRDELKPLLTKEPPSIEDEPRILQLLTQLEHSAPPHLREAVPGMLVFRRALALRTHGKLGLALLEMEEARRARPDDPEVVFVYLDLLRLEDLPSAVVEAETIAGLPSVPALVLSACINILATQAEQASDDQFEPVAERVLALCHRFDQAPDLDQVGPRSWPCLTSTGESCTCERAESLWLDRHLKALNGLIPLVPYSTSSPGSRLMIVTPEVARACAKLWVGGTRRV